MLKKKRCERLLEIAAVQKWLVGYQDECWWSRLAQPNLHSWSAEQPVRLIQKTKSKTDATPTALCCYGMLQAATGQRWLRFVAGQANGKATIAYLEWLSEVLSKQGHSRLLLIWDNASWHKTHNQAARRERKDGKAALTIIPCWLPVQSPCDSPIEPKWLHGKRAVVEPERILPLSELTERVCAYYQVPALPLLAH
jgi:DDE superfamily endonuclease